MVVLYLPGRQSILLEMMHSLGVTHSGKTKYFSHKPYMQLYLSKDNVHTQIAVFQHLAAD